MLLTGKQINDDLQKCFLELNHYCVVLDHESDKFIGTDDLSFTVSDYRNIRMHLSLIADATNEIRQYLDECLGLKDK